jgi:hypothetical protein
VLSGTTPRLVSNAGIAQLPLVFSYGNDVSRTYPTGDRRKLPRVLANPRNNATVKATRSRRQSPPIRAQPGSAKTGLPVRLLVQGRRAKFRQRGDRAAAATALGPGSSAAASAASARSYGQTQMP